MLTWSGIPITTAPSLFVRSPKLLAAGSFPHRPLYPRLRHVLTGRVRSRGAMTTPDQRYVEGMISNAMGFDVCYPVRLDPRHAPVIIVEEKQCKNHRHILGVSALVRPCRGNWHPHRYQARPERFRRGRPLLQEEVASCLNHLAIDICAMIK